MKKYLVKVIYSDPKVSNLVAVIKAKNDLQCEAFVNNWLSDLVEDINGYEYDKAPYIPAKWQFKYKCPRYVMCGNWVGSDCIKNWNLNSKEYKRIK